MATRHEIPTTAPRWQYDSSPSGGAGVGVAVWTTACVSMVTPVISMAFSNTGIVETTVVTIAVSSVSVFALTLSDTEAAVVEAGTSMLYSTNKPPLNRRPWLDSDADTVTVTSEAVTPAAAANCSANPFSNASLASGSPRIADVFDTETTRLPATILGIAGVVLLAASAAAVGLAVGSATAMVGAAVGPSVVGASVVGAAVGSIVGALVGALVGTEVGAEVGATQTPLGVAPLHMTAPRKPSAHLQFGPACMLLFSMLHGAAVQVPFAIVVLAWETHAIVPE
jgi:hypothetical protein